MKTLFGVGLALSLGALAAGCAVTVRPPPPAIPVVPVSFEANLLTAQQCEYRGIARSQDDARDQGANLLLAFENAQETAYSVTESNKAKGPHEASVWIASSMRAKAVNCPKEALDRVLAMPSNGGAQ